jgi:CDP-4-dehydro-6-deoxyglucose reductase/3-phenylpropionate/trans-cinnamate dioxygenase ferredoxin reductase subunit
VQDAVLADYPDLTGHEVYACGSELMTATALDTLVRERGIDPQRFHSDAFVSAAAALTVPA